MAGRERSKGGCWTCKLRKKKCDEGRPSCATCLSLGIKCHAYGSKPACMDGGSAEKAQLEAWRQKVKEITNHRRKLRVRPDAPRSPQEHHFHENDHVPLTPASAEDAHLTPQSLPLLNDSSLNEVYEKSTALSNTQIPQWPPGRLEGFNWGCWRLGSTVHYLLYL